MSYPINNDAELLAHFDQVAAATGIDGMEISIACTAGHDGKRTINFYVTTGYSSPFGSTEGTIADTVSGAVAQFRPKIAAKAKARARELRQQAEKLLSQADSLDSSELTVPPPKP